MIGSRTTPDSNRLTFGHFGACFGSREVLVDDADAAHLAPSQWRRRASVTVSMAADTSGIFRRCCGSAGS